jgi:hypothetical protein
MANLDSTRVASTFPVAAPAVGGVLCVAYGSYTLAANPTAADVIRFCRVPAGATVIGGYLQGADLDTNATEELNIDLGWAANGAELADPDGLGNFDVLTGDASVHMPVAGIYLPFQGVLITTGPQTFTRETIIQAVVNVDAATGGTGILTCVVFYVMP